MTAARASSPLSLLFVGAASRQRDTLLDQLRAAPGWELDCGTAETAGAALEALQRGFRDLVFVEHPSPGSDAIVLVSQIRQLHPKTAVVVVTPGADDARAVALMKSGALDYLRYPDLRSFDASRLLRRVVELRYLVDQNVELQQVNQMKNEFIANVSHELRTPLSVIIGFAENLKTGGLGPVAPPQLRALESITGRAEELLRTLNQILRIGEGQQRLMLKPLDLRGLAVEVAGLPSREARRKNIRVETALPPEPVWVRGDVEKLTIVIENLLSNAVKFGPAGSVVTLSIGAADQRATISVSDSGPGVPQEMLPRLFEPLGAAAHGPTREHGGLGLGLPLSKRIVEQHQGRLWLESLERRGCTAFVSLPLALPDSPVLAVPGGPGMERKRVLLVDDNPEVIDVLLLFMSSMSDNLELDTARSGLEAIERIKARKPDLIILDIMMPGMDGYEVLDRLRRAPGTTALPVLVITGYPEAAEKAKTQGAHDVLLKPLERKAFCDKIEQLLRASPQAKAQP